MFEKALERVLVRRVVHGNAPRHRQVSHHSLLDKVSGDIQDQSGMGDGRFYTERR